MVKEALDGAFAFLALGVLVWVPLFPALVWGKSAIPGPEIRRLLGRAARLTVVAGLPVMMIAAVLFSWLSPDRLPVPELLARCAGGAVGFLPLYGALITTSIFQKRHRADRESGVARPFAVRLLAGLVILAANLLAGTVIFFVLFAATGVYRGWR
jgi:hypothetical protein